MSEMIVYGAVLWREVNNNKHADEMDVPDL